MAASQEVTKPRNPNREKVEQRQAKMLQHQRAKEQTRFMLKVGILVGAFSIVASFIYIVLFASIVTYLNVEDATLLKKVMDSRTDNLVFSASPSVQGHH